MKPAAFEHARPASVADAIWLAGRQAGARVLAGGQSLGPMLNLRLAQPRLLVAGESPARADAGVAADADAVTIGACVTHAAIEDGLVPDIGCGVLAAWRETHRLSRGAQSRHDRRQPVPCRSRGGLGRRC